mgnify:FL=1
MMAHPLTTEYQYPYVSGNGVAYACNNAAAATGSYRVASYTQVAASSTAIKSAINLKPVSVAIEADTYVF